MQALGVAAPDPDTVLATIVPGLSGHGSVAVIQEGTVSEPEHPDITATYEIGSDGWTATGDRTDLPTVLDRVAQDHDYGVVVGWPSSRVPHLVVGDRSVRRELLRVPDSAAIDVDTVIDAVDAAQPYETLGSLVAKAKAATGSEYAGAIATFTGRVRPRDSADDDRTNRLEFERYDAIAAERMAEIRQELRAREGVQEVLLYHRVGVVEAEEDIVFVVVLAGHREQAFQTVEDGINRLKAEVPIFKKEVTVGDEFWVHDRD